MQWFDTESCIVGLRFDIPIVQKVDYWQPNLPHTEPASKDTNVRGHFLAHSTVEASGGFGFEPRTCYIFGQSLPTLLPIELHAKGLSSSYFLVMYYA